MMGSEDPERVCVENGHLEGTNTVPDMYGVFNQ